LLNDAGSREHMVAMSDVTHTESYDIAGSELGVDGYVEKGKVTGVFGHL